jgi:hypothetical protein
MPKYKCIETIPAKIFFDILTTKDYQKLKPKPKEEGLEKIFMDIYDEFFVRSDNGEAKDYMRLTCDRAFLTYKIATIKQVLHYIFYNKMTVSMLYDIIDALKVGCGIEIDKDKPFADEIQRVLQVEIGIIQNDLKLAEIELADMSKSSVEKVFDYYDNIVALGNVHNRNIAEDMTLAMYIALEKSANRIIKEQQNNK